MGKGRGRGRGRGRGKRKKRAYLAGCIHMQVIVVGNELHGGVPDVFGRELARSLYQCDHDVCVPLQVWEEPADKLLAVIPGLIASACKPIAEMANSSIGRSDSQC